MNKFWSTFTKRTETRIAWCGATFSRIWTAEVENLVERGGSITLTQKLKDPSGQSKNNGYFSFSAISRRRSGPLFPKLSWVEPTTPSKTIGTQDSARESTICRKLMSFTLSARKSKSCFNCWINKRNFKSCQLTSLRANSAHNSRKTSKITWGV